jgi:serine protease Do
MLSSQGFVPVATKFVAYRPNHQGGEPVELISASDDTDVALLKYLKESGRPKGLQLANTPPEPGDQIIVMGYPTGLRALLAQAGGGFVKELQKSGNIGFWEVAARLSKSGLIIPLASRGIVGRTSNERIVYDAETTHGGSGGPVLNTEGKVVAVNAAILPNFGGANLGVPSREVSGFLKKLGLN